MRAAEGFKSLYTFMRACFKEGLPVTCAKDSYAGSTAPEEVGLCRQRGSTNATPSRAHFHPSLWSPEGTMIYSYRKATIGSTRIARRAGM